MIDDDPRDKDGGAAGGPRPEVLNEPRSASEQAGRDQGSDASGSEGPSSGDTGWQWADGRQENPRGADWRDSPRREGAGAGDDDGSLFQRLIYMILIAIMLYFASTILTLCTVVQFVLMLLNKGQRNEDIARFGEGLGIWIAKAARYQVAASKVKPWPWSEID